MTTPTPRWTAETEAAATRALWKHGHLGAPLDEATERDEPAAVAFTRGAARAVLDSLARVGVLIPVGGETRQQWRVTVPAHPLAGAQVYQDRRGAEAYRRAIVKPTQLLTRTVHTEPWREVTDDPA